MAVDAGTIWASIRIRLDKLNTDVSSATKAMDGMAKSINESGKAVENLNKMGQKMSLMVTAPLVAAGAAAVKFASDQGEALNAANVVFKSSSKTITDWGKNAAKQAGLSQAEFYQSAAVTGSMLKGMNFTLDESAEATIELTKRAADMASIFNTDVKDATGAVAAALRGEMEPIRRYGVTLSEATVQAKAMQMGLVTAGQEITNYAKAQARIALIMEQTNDIQGDFVNTSDQLANKTRVTVAEVKNQAAALGQQLLPFMLQIITAAQKMVDGFANLSDEQKKSILQIAALAAGIGPALIGISKMIQAVNALKIAMTALSANPITLAVLGIAGVTAGVVALGNAVEQSRLDDLKKEFEDVAVLSNTAKENINAVNEALRMMGQQGFERLAPEDLSQKLQEMAMRLGISADEVFAIGVNSEYVNEAMKENIRLAQKAYEKAVDRSDSASALAKLKQAEMDADEGIVENAAKAAELAKKKADAEERAAAARKAAKEAEDKQIAERQAAEKEYNKAIEQTRLLVAKGIIDTEEGRTREISATEQYRDTLIDLGYAMSNEVGTKGATALQAAVNRLDELGAAAKTGEEDFSGLVERVTELTKEVDKSGSAQTDALIAEIQASGLAIEKKEELIEAVQRYKEELEDKQAFDTFIANADYAFNQVNSLMSSLSSLFAQVYENKAEAIDQAMQSELEANGLAEDSAVEKAEKELQVAIDTGNAESIAEAQNALKKAQIEEKYAKQKAEVEYEGAMMLWNLQRLQVLASTAQAIMTAAASTPWPWNLIPIGFATGIGAVQAATVAQAKPTRSFQTGGIVEARSGGELVNVAENGSGEVLFNTGATGHAFTEQMGAAIASYLGGSAGMAAQIYIVLSEEVIAESTVRLINDGKYTIEARGIR
jgi:hypothetical protein